MAVPRTTYTSTYPDDKYSGNIQQERTESGRLIANARDYNIHDVEIRALQCFLGFTGPGSGFGPFNPSGPKPGTGDTIVDRLIRIAGTSSVVCIDEAAICNYNGPNGIDPSGTTYISTTATWVGAPWLNPGVGVPGVPPVPPVNPNPGPAVVPWPKPGGAPQGPVPFFPAPFNPPVPPGPFSLAGPAAMDMDEWLRYIQWLTTLNAYRHDSLSSETINIWARVYDELPSAIREVVSLLDGWPSGRTLPSTLNRASLLDATFSSMAVVKHLLSGLGIGIYTGTVTAGYVNFTTTSPFDAGAPGRSAGDLVTLLSNNYHASFDSSNLLDLETHPGGVAVTGPQVAGSYRVTGTAAFDLTAGTEVLVLVYHGTPYKSVQGDESTWREELLGGGGPTFVTSEVPIDGKGARPIFTVWVRTGPGTPWVPVAYNGTGLASDATDFGYAPGTKMLDTFGPAGYTEARVLYQCERVI
jgi:hypothetical protein